MLRDAAGAAKVYIACGFTDLWKGIPGLTSIIQEQFGMNPLQKGTLFMFCGRRNDRIKCVIFEGDGFLLLYKKLAPGFRYQWPRTVQEVKELSPEQFQYLMKGFNPLQKGLIGDVKASRIG